MQYLTRKEVELIPEHPLMVFSYEIGAFISAGVVGKEGGLFSHFMWYVGDGMVASQDKNYKIWSIEEYLNSCLLEFWHDPNWRPDQKEMLMSCIIEEVAQDKAFISYDVLAIIGQLTDQEWIQIPGFDICSDKGKYIASIDPDYDLKKPSPANVRRWLKNNERYAIYGRYMPL